MKQRFFVIIAVLFASISVVSVGLNVYWYRELHPGTNASKNITDKASAEMLRTISTVVELPDETPSVVTVTDRDKLQSQPFFQKAQNGDVIFIFETARRIFLYRPSIRKIIDTVPLVFITPTGQPASSSSPTPEPPFGQFGNGGSPTDVTPAVPVGQP